jgi:hypothetical protein
VTIIDALALTATTWWLAPRVSFARTVIAGPGLGAAFVPGAFARDPTATVEPLRITLRRRNDPWRPVLAFDQAKGPQFQDQLNEPGAGSLVLANDDPDLAQVQAGDMVVFETDGWAAFTLWVRQWDRVSVAQAEEAAHLTTLSGPGNLAVLEEALVFPSRGPGSWPIEEDRVFSWPAPDFNDGTWVNARELARWSDATFWTVDSQPGSPPAPSNWPDPDARWIWARSATWRWAPDGTCYVRRNFTVPTGVRKAAVYVTCDWQGEIYLDGQHLGSNAWEVADTKFFREEIDISPGPHTIAISCANDVDPEGDEDHNPGGILCAIFAMGNAGLGDLIVHSDASWKILEYPATPPGMTPGEAMLHTLNEAKARGTVNDVTPSFTEQVDSAGQPWPVVGDIATKVGTDLLTFYRELTQTYTDLAMSPAGSVLYAWRSGTRGRDTGVSLHPPTDPTDPYSGNLVNLTHKSALFGKQKVLVRWSGGWDSVGPNGREATLGLGALQSREEMQRVATAQLADINDVRTQITAQAAPTGAADTPVSAFGVGDLVAVPDWNGAPVSVRVLSITGALDDDGYLTWSLDLKDRILDARERAEQSDKKMANGTLRGASKVAQPVGNIARRQLPHVDGGDGGCG